jgi:hypothetical protein
MVRVETDNHGGMGEQSQYAYHLKNRGLKAHALER